jgi:hypothetical protein
MLKFRLGLLLALVLGLVAGCGTNSATPARVSGTVTYNGQPVKAGNISFHTDKGSYSSSLSATGTYEIVDLPMGSAAVTIETESQNPDKKAQAYGGGMGPKMDPGKMAGGAPAGAGGKSKEEMAALYVKIPAKYADPKTTTLNVTLERGRQVKNFDLTD